MGNVTYRNSATRLDRQLWQCQRPVSGVNLATLAQKGSLYVSRPTLFDYYHNPAERAAGAEYVFDMFRQGVIEMTIGQRYALEDAAQAHRDLEARKTIGSSALIPSGTK